MLNRLTPEQAVVYFYAATVEELKNGEIYLININKNCNIITGLL